MANEKSPIRDWRLELENKVLNATCGKVSTFTGECSLCKNQGEFQTSASPLLIPQFEESEDGKYTMSVLHSKGLLFVTRACRSCGHTELFSLSALGIKPE